MKVLFVCTGNVCRSPMGEGFLRARRPDLDVRSSGTHAWDGRPATYDAREVMRAAGVPIDGHRARELTSELISWADVIVALAAEHRRDIVRSFPEADGRVWMLSMLAGRGEADVDDPFGERKAAYRRVCAEIKELVDEWVDRGF